MTVELLSKFIIQFGFPTTIAIGFCYWFFIKHLPSLQDSTEKRFHELKKTHTEALLAQERAQEKALDKQNIIFEHAMSQIVDKISIGFSEIKQEIHILHDLIGEKNPMRSKFLQRKSIGKTEKNGEKEHERTIFLGKGS